jgi:hypothetical protein
MKCQICKTNNTEWAFQPFGPDEKWSFSLPGYHYRGFATIKICDHCKEVIQNPYKFPNVNQGFDYKGKHFVIFEDSVIESPF